MWNWHTSCRLSQRALCFGCVSSESLCGYVCVPPCAWLMELQWYCRERGREGGDGITVAVNAEWWASRKGEDYREGVEDRGGPGGETSVVERHQDTCIRKLQCFVGEASNMAHGKNSSSSENHTSDITPPFMAFDFQSCCFILYFYICHP